MHAPALQRAITDHLRYSVGRPAAALRPEHYYRALALAVRDRMQDRRVASTQTSLDLGRKVTCYLSAEFLMGPQLGNNLLNLQMEQAAKTALAAMGQDLDEILACEEEPGLGNGGLGRLAACYLDSLATLERPAIGYGIRYEFGIFNQEIRDGWQVEQTDNWLANGNPWEIAKPDVNYLVKWGGYAEHYTDEAGHDRVRWVPGAAAERRRLRHAHPGLRRQHLQRADVVERAGRQVVRAGSLQHRRLLQGGRGRGHLGDGHQGAVPQRRAGGGQAAAPAPAVLLRVLLAAARAAHHGRPGRRGRQGTPRSGSPCSSTTPIRRSRSPS